MAQNDGIPTPKTAKRVTDAKRITATERITATQRITATKRVTDDRALYVISVAAELAGVHPQTLRMYERKGLLRPQRTEGRARRYSDRDIEHVRLIQELTQTHGVNLAGVEMVMELTRRVEEMQQRMKDLMRDGS